MNRSFYAFGVLLALLALAIIAVGSSSRSTTVQIQPPGEGGEGSLLSPVRHGTIFVVVLPAADETKSLAIQPVTLTEVVAGPQIQSVVVVAADCDAALRSQPEIDCRSHYDRGYDELVYGRKAASDSGAEPVAAPTATTEELISLFHSLSPSKSARAASQSSSRWHGQETVPQHTSSTRQHVRGWQTTLRGAGRWLATRAGEFTAGRHNGEPAVSWSEYAGLMDMIETEQIVASHSPASAAAEAVRSGGWLLHFAVSSLGRMGLTLERAAADLQRYERAVSDGE